MKIAILGGGISGLSLAYHLIRLINNPDFEIHVFEKESEPGGLCRTMRIGDFLFDYGPHNFHSRILGFHESMHQLIGEDYREQQFVAQVVFRGRFIPYPMSGADVLKSVPFSTSLACALSFLASLIVRPISPEESFQCFIEQRFGRKMYDVYFGPFTRKVWGIEGSELSADFGKERIGTYNLWDVFKRVFLGIRSRATTTSENPFVDIRRFYPPSGSGQVIDALFEFCNSDPRFHLHTGTIVTGLKRADSRIDAVETDRGIYPFDFVFSSISLSSLGDFLGTRSDLLSFIATRFLLLMIDRDRILDSSPWVFFADSEIRFNRVSELGIICDGMCPEGKTSLIVEFTSTGQDEVWNASEGKLLEWAFAGLEHNGLLISSDVIDWRVISVWNTHPLRRVGYRSEVDRLKRIIGSFDNLRTFGRQGTFSHLNMDHCYHSACELANSFLRDFFEEDDSHGHRV